MCVSSDNFVRENPRTWQQRPSVQEKSPTGCLLCCTVCLTSKAGLNEVLWCGSVPHGQAFLLIYLFIYLFDKPFSNGCCHRRLLGLSRGNIKVFVDSAGGFWSKLIGFFFSPFFSEQFMYVLLSTISSQTRFIYSPI